MGRLVLINDVDEAGAVGEGEDVGREGETGEEGEEEFHVVGWLEITWSLLEHCCIRR